MAYEIEPTRELILRNSSNGNSTLRSSFQTVDYFVRRNYLSELSKSSVVMFQPPSSTNHIRIFLIDKIIFDENEEINEKLTSVYNALYAMDVTVFVLIRGRKTGVEFYMGARSNSSAGIPGDVLEQSFMAHFPGSTMKKQEDDALRRILNDQRFDNISSVTVVPASREENEKKFIQGVEKLIDTMQGKDYSAIFIATPHSREDINRNRLGLEQIFSVVSPYAKTTFAYGENQSEAISKGTFKNFTNTINEGISNTVGTSVTSSRSHSSGFSLAGSTSSKGDSISYGVSESETTSSGTARSKGSGSNENTTMTAGTSITLTNEAVDKTADGLLTYIDEQLERIKGYESFGAWESAAYFCAAKIEDSIVAANTFRAMIAGDKSNAEYSCINTWDVLNENTSAVAKYLQYCCHPSFVVNDGNHVTSCTVTAGSLISAKELPIFMSLPQKSVSGITVTTMAEFSRNVSQRATDSGASTRKIPLGCVHHMGRDEEQNKVTLDLNSFTSHCFICGSTGSGKSNTTYHLLHRFISNGVPFLVVEPAKGEYKTVFGKVSGIHIYGTNPYMGAMLKINPFEFHPSIHVLEHIDRLIEIFNACWEMYAAMPAILKNAIEKAYSKRGWDLQNSIFLKKGMIQYPTFSDVLAVLPQIIRNSSYSSDTQGDYTGALVTRVESLTNGLTGQIFCDNYFIPDSTLFDENTIVDLSRVGSAETKSLIMGILVMRLNEYRMANATGSNKELRHITVLEEAHHLLKNVSQTQGQQTANPIGKSVEMICNSIAEMRTYGEGFIIVDQSPSSVDIAAIKNTNTKIAMRLPEKSDREAIGSSLALNEDQIKEISKLPVGVAVVLQNNWLEAVLCKINRAREERYYIEPEFNTFDQMKRLRGVALEALMQTYNTSREVNLPILISLVNEVDASPAAKKEMYDRLEALSVAVNEYKDKGYFYTSLLHISGLRGIMSASADSIMGHETDNAVLETWKAGLLEQFPLYVSFQNESSYELLFIRCTTAMSYSHGNVNYNQVLRTLYLEK